MKLRDYLEKSAWQYDLAIDKFLYKNYDSVRDFMTPKMVTQGFRMNVFKSMDEYVSKHFSSTEIQKIMQYPLVFLGASPKNAPALYNIMSHIDFNQGVYYPQGGIYKFVETLVGLSNERGVRIVTSKPVASITVEDGAATGVRFEDGSSDDADFVISNADIEFTESKLLADKYRSYSKKYWEKRTLAPSALLMYLGSNKQFPKLRHHNLVFSKDWDANFNALFKTKKWPADPSFYVCNPNKTDPGTAPAGKENLFVLVPLPANTNYDDSELEAYADKVLDTMERTMHLDGLKQSLVYKKLFAAKDFESEFNSFHGTALGLAHTLKQTAVYRPSNKSKKVSNLYYAGANTVPGIGLPMCLISAQLVYKRMIGDKSSSSLSEIRSEA
jgi:phytoene desaturase